MPPPASATTPRPGRLITRLAVLIVIMLLGAAIGHGTRPIQILGAAGYPVQPWVVQQARNLLMDLEDAGTQVKFVLRDPEGHPERCALQPFCVRPEHVVAPPQASASDRVSHPASGC